MTFTRSKNGIKNRGLFTRSNFTIYIETDPNEFQRNGLDISLWRAFFSKYYENFKIKFVPLGGKTHVKSMAEKIVRDSISNSFCAMDRDYDDLFGEVILDDRVFYTFGYGVENDAISDQMIFSLASGLVPSLGHINEHAVEISRLLETTFSSERLCFLSDQIGKSRDFCPLNRNNPTSDIDHSDNKLPVKLRKTDILNSLSKGPKTKLRNYVRSLDACKRYVPAHHYFEIVFHTFYRYVHRETGAKIKKSTFISLVCLALQNNFFQFLIGEIRSYFDDMGSRNLALYQT